MDGHGEWPPGSPGARRMMPPRPPQLAAWVLRLLIPPAWPEELVSIRHDAPGLDMMGMPNATGLHVFYSQASRSFDALALYSARTETLTGDGAPERVAIGRATPSLFDVLGARPAIGRLRFESLHGRTALPSRCRRPPHLRVGGRRASSREPGRHLDSGGAGRRDRPGTGAEMGMIGLLRRCGRRHPDAVLEG